MKRDDLRNIEGEYLLSGHPVTDDELVEVISSDPDLMAKVLGGGRWVPWCVTHGSTGVVPEATWCSSATYSLGDCVWHRAFIPEVEEAHDE